MDPMLLLIGLASASATGLFVVYAYQHAAAPGRVARSRVLPTQGTRIALGSPLRSGRRSTIPFVDLLPVSAEAREQLEQRLALAGVPLRVAEFVGLRVAVAAIAILVGAFFAGAIFSLQFAPALAVTFATMFVGWQLPSIWLSRVRSRRLKVIQEQLPVALNALAKSLRAGTGLLQAIDYTAEQTGSPLGVEFAATVRELRLGADPEEAFNGLSQRVGSPDLDIAITGIIIQRTVGGNLSEILTSVSHTIDERVKLHREIQILTSRQRFTGNMIAIIPVAVAAAFLLINPELGDLLINTTAGRIALVIGIAFEAVGLLLIHKLSKVEV